MIGITSSGINRLRNLCFTTGVRLELLLSEIIKFSCARTEGSDIFPDWNSKFSFLLNIAYFCMKMACTSGVSVQGKKPDRSDQANVKQEG